MKEMKSVDLRTCGATMVASRLEGMVCQVSKRNVDISLLLILAHLLLQCMDLK